MKYSFSSPRVVCRPALPRDFDDVREFCKGIWDGHDYVPFVFRDWLADPHGILAAAEYAGRCVGIAKVTLLSPGQWWLEGFRVDPKLQGLKIGSHIHEYVDEWWLSNGDGIARLMTSAKRVKVHHLCEKLGYVKTAEVSGYHGPAIPDAPTDSFHPVKETDWKAALEFASKSQTLKLTGLVDMGWRQAVPDETLLREMIAAQKAFWWRDRAGLLLTWDDREDDEKTLGICLPACELNALPEFLLEIRHLAAQQTCTDAYWIAPAGASVAAALTSAGYATDWDAAGFIYEKKHPTA